MIASHARRIGLDAGFLLILLIACGLRCARGEAANRGKVPLPEQSAGIFIGIEKFSYDSSLTDVVYAANDAVDLAYALAIEHRLLPVNRVLLLLAGKPEGASNWRLDRLLAGGATAGAIRREARQADIYSLVDVQSRLVGEQGILVLSMSTHGFSDGGEHLLLAQDSLLEYRTGVTAANLLQATRPGESGLRLLLIDACRAQLVKPPSRDGRAGSQADSRSVMRAQLLETLAQNRGYAVLSAAGVGGLSYAGDGNGYFTRAVLEGLHCLKGEKIKTLDSLASFVRDEVPKRSHGLQHPEVRVGGRTGDFALLECGGQERPGPRPHPEPIPEPVAAATLQKIASARNLLAAGGMDNVEQSFRLYRQAFEELPAGALPTLNQGLLARARQLDDSSRADEGAQIYSQLLDVLLAQSGAGNH
jgi:hypothetical protein